MTSTTRWWLIRHAPVINPDRLVYGQADMPVDLSDSASLDRLAAVLPHGAVWVTSPLSRTGDTALALADRLGEEISPFSEADLAEQAFGDWELKRWAEIEREEVIEFWTDFARLGPPGGETFTRVMERSGDALERLTTHHKGRDIVAVIHGGSVRGCLGHALRLRAESALVFHVDTLGLTVMEYLDSTMRPGWRVTGVNLRP